ncbi:MAG: carboxymuconolactone decarboxylase family protein [Rhizobium sp.]|nr:carboxymuconolactone decarboxylase family protein [Rhizobium sp.]MBX9455634.1 carboxymuconolactone decarboxylase family protein [Rhizobium sp.]
MRNLAIIVATTLTLVCGSQVATAQDVKAESEATYQDIFKTYGVVPGFAKAYPKHVIAGAWQMTKSLETSPENKLDSKTKALINLAVAAQIPCRYCVWIETEAAKKAGASQDEVAEAVAQAAYVRHWSTVLNGMQIDFDAFKAEFGSQ